MIAANIDNQKLCKALFSAESEADVTKILNKHDLLDPVHWKPLGDMPNNLSMVNNQQDDPAGAFVENITNAIDAMLLKACLLEGIDPKSSAAPQTMSEAIERFFGVHDGNLANAVNIKEMAENIQVVATGTKPNPSYLIIDHGEGQTPLRFEDTFLCLRKSNKGAIPFVQGKFNCGGTGVIPFCGRKSYKLIVSRRDPNLPSGPSPTDGKDSSHNRWGFTIIRKLPPSAGVYDTTVYVYLAPGGQIASFDADYISAIPDIDRKDVGTESDEVEAKGSRKRPIPTPYSGPLKSGTVVKLYDYNWNARGLATLEVRFQLEQYLYELGLPFRVIETRKGYRANYFATTVAGLAVTIAKDQDRGFLEIEPHGGVIHPDGIGTLPISISLYRERSKDGVPAKDPRRLPKGIKFTINGQVHYSEGSVFFITRGLNYEFLRKTLMVTVDCTHIEQDIRDVLIMPSRDRLRKVTEFGRIIQSIVGDLKDRPFLKRINDERKLRRTKEALSREAVQDVFQKLIGRNPVFASLFKNGKGLRDPYDTGKEKDKEPYKGKLPPTYFRFANGKHQMNKSFDIDRTCAVELETDVVNGYFKLPDPMKRGSLCIEPACHERWNLSNGKLRFVFRAPINARIGDRIVVTTTVKDPYLDAICKEPWVNKVHLSFTEGGKTTKSGSDKRRRSSTGSLGMPEVIPVKKDEWEDHSFNERSALKIVQRDDKSYIFFVNIDNTYLQNELLRRNDAEKESSKFAYQWGLVLVALGMLQEAKNIEKTLTSNNDEVSEHYNITEEVGRFSIGVAAVIVPIVLNLMDTMKDVESGTAATVG